MSLKKISGFQFACAISVKDGLGFSTVFVDRVRLEPFLASALALQPSPQGHPLCEKLKKAEAEKMESDTCSLMMQGHAAACFKNAARRKANQYRGCSASTQVPLSTFRHQPRSELLPPNARAVFFYMNAYSVVFSQKLRRWVAAGSGGGGRHGQAQQQRISFFCDEMLRCCSFVLFTSWLTFLITCPPCFALTSMPR